MKWRACQIKMPEAKSNKCLHLAHRYYTNRNIIDFFCSSRDSLYICVKSLDMIHNGMQSKETQLFLLQESVLLGFFLSPWPLHSLPCGGPQAGTKGSRMLRLFCPGGWWECPGPGRSSCSPLTGRRELTHWDELGNQTEQDLLSLLHTSWLQPLGPRTGDGHHHHQLWMKKIGFVVNSIVLEHVNHASGDLEVQHAGYESQNSFRLQVMQPE